MRIIVISGFLFISIVTGAFFFKDNHSIVQRRSSVSFVNNVMPPLLERFSERSNSKKMNQDQPLIDREYIKHKVSQIGNDGLQIRKKEIETVINKKKYISRFNSHSLSKDEILELRSLVFESSLISIRLAEMI